MLPLPELPAFYSYASLTRWQSANPNPTKKPKLDTLTVPPQQFQALLTLSSEFFSTFVHTTCSLSVLLSYLALDGIYHPFQTPLPKSPTLQSINIKRQMKRATTGLSPSLVSDSSELVLPKCRKEILHKTTIRKPLTGLQILNLSFYRFGRPY